VPKPDASLMLYCPEKDEVIKIMEDVKEDLNLPSRRALLLLFLRMYYKNKEAFFKELFEFIPLLSLYNSKKIPLETLLKKPVDEVIKEKG